MRLSSILALVSVTIAVGCTAAECPVGYTMNGDGLCVENPSADTGVVDTDTDTAVDTDADTDTETGKDTDTSEATDTGELPAYTVCDDGVAPYNDIQDAVDDANDGDTIYVCAGTYGYVTLDRDDVSLVGLDGADVTIIDGESHTALTIDSVKASIQGFTVTGVGPNGDTYTGGLYLSDADATFTDVTVRGCTNGSSSRNAVTQRGGTTTWERVTFEENDVSSVYYAYDLVEEDPGSTTMSHVVFRDNIGTTFYAEGLDVDLKNSLFYDNVGASGQNPVYFQPDNVGKMTIWNNTFANIETPGNRGCVAVGAGGNFQNNIVAGCEGTVSLNPDATGDYNNFYDNGTEHGYGNVDWGSGGEEGVGTLTSDPFFTDEEAGDFTLQVGFSPCIDMGNPLAGYNDVDGTRNDMGAFGGPGGDWAP